MGTPWKGFPVSKHDRFSRGAKQLARSADIPLSVAKRLLEQGISEHRKINDGTARPVATGKETAEVLEDSGCRNIAELQHRQRREGDAPMKRLLLLGDELLMLLRPTSGSSDAATLRAAHAQLKEVALTGRAMGIHLLLTANAVQESDVSSELLAQLGCRIALGPINQYVATKLFDDPTKTNDTHRKGALLAYSHTAGYQRAQLMYLDDRS